MNEAIFVLLSGGFVADNRYFGSTSSLVGKCDETEKKAFSNKFHPCDARIMQQLLLDKKD